MIPKYLVPFFFQEKVYSRLSFLLPASLSIPLPFPSMSSIPVYSKPKSRDDPCVAALFLSLMPSCRIQAKFLKNIFLSCYPTIFLFGLPFPD